VPVRIREASVEDAPAIAYVHVAAWRVAYRGLLPQEHLDQLDEGRRAEVWAHLISSAGGAFPHRASPSWMVGDHLGSRTLRRRVTPMLPLTGRFRRSMSTPIVGVREPDGP